MTSPSLSFDKKISRPERQNRVLAVAVAGLALLAILGAADHPDVSRVTSCQLTDEHGNVSAELAIKDGTVGLFLKDEDGNDRLQAFHDSSGTGVYINDETGTTRIGVAQFAHSGGGVALRGPGSKGAAVLYLKDEGSLRFFDPEGHVTNQVLATGPRDE